MILFEMFTQRFVMIMLVLAANPTVLHPWIRCKSRNGDLISDDIDIIGWNTSTVYDAYTRLEREAARIGLLINATKTKYLLVGGSDSDRLARLGSSVSVDGDELEVVEAFFLLPRHCRNFGSQRKQ